VGEEPEYKAALLNELLLNGIPESAAKHALVATGNSTTDAAISWYFEHMSDPGTNKFPTAALKAPPTKVKKQETVAAEDKILQLIDFGYSRPQAVFGLTHTVFCFPVTVSRTTTSKEPSSTSATIPSTKLPHQHQLQLQHQPQSL
jgi:uncharacterized UBP type Zn finger protein